MALDLKALAQREAEAKTKASNDLLMSQRDIDGSVMIRLVIDPDGRYHNGCRWFFPLVEYFFAGLNPEDEKKKVMFTMSTVWTGTGYEVHDIVAEHLTKMLEHEDKSVRSQAKKLLQSDYKNTMNVFDCIVLTGSEDLNEDDYDYNTSVKGLKVTNGVRSELAALLTTETVHRIKDYVKDARGMIKRTYRDLDPNSDGAWSMEDPGTVFMISKTGEGKQTKYKVSATDFQIRVPEGYEQPSLLQWLNKNQVKPEQYVIDCLDYLLGLTDDIPELSDYIEEQEAIKPAVKQTKPSKYYEDEDVKQSKNKKRVVEDDEEDDEDVPPARNTRTATMRTNAPEPEQRKRGGIKID